MVKYKSYMTVSKIYESHMNYMWHLGSDIVTYGLIRIFKAEIVTFESYMTV